MSQKSMAELAGIARQSYASIEAGTSVPSTEVSLRLARGLGVKVEDLFRLSDDPPEIVDVEAVGSISDREGPIRLVGVGGRQLGVSLRGSTGPSLTLADGTGSELPGGRARVRLFAERPQQCDLVVAGCDPSFELVARALKRESGLETVWVRRGSRAVLQGLAKGHGHVAGVHLLDPETGAYNERWIHEMIPFPCTRVRYAQWQQALILATGNPLGVAGLQDLVSPELRFVNREPGSGSRALIDTCIEEEGIPETAISGYRETTASGHLAVAEAVASGLGDVGVGIHAAALAFGLDSLPLREEMYDLVIPNHFLDYPAVQTLLKLLRTRSIQAQIEALGGYDTLQMGLPL